MRLSSLATGGGRQASLISCIAWLLLPAPALAFPLQSSFVTTSAPTGSPTSTAPTTTLAADHHHPVTRHPKPDSDAEPQSVLRRRWHATLYGSAWAEINLPSLPVRLLTLDIPFRKAYFLSVGLGYALIPDFTLPLGLFDLRGCDLELDAQLLRHLGHQNHWEASAALVWRTGDGVIANTLAINFAVGEGFSYAFSPPHYEKGPQGRRGENSVHFQNHLLFELEFTALALPQLRLALRLHHRSGIYGLISPQKTGSNFIGLGLRFST